ncbi:MAG: diguanylate cyclase [Oscillospiraceae bacterium]|nr:diguanylate cyclase [Oscillospiraceae bacterium]
MQSIKKLFQTASDPRMTDAINIRNIRNVYAFSLVVCIVEAVPLLLYVMFSRNSPGFLRTLLSVSYCVAACGTVAVLSRMIVRKYNREGVISNLRSNALVTFFYLIMSAWSVLVDAAHYGDGNQMMTFYIVQFCFISFVVIRPRIGSVLIALAFSALYFALYAQDGAIHIQLQNYYIFAIIAVFSNAMQYMLLNKSEKSKLEIQELNQILQQEVTIDALTMLKNRKALRDNFDKHIGKTVSVMMADIDHFKSYNDSYGHAVGDTVLRMVASAIMEAFQGGEAYRYGGDEFLIILPDCTEEAFEEKKEKWKKAVGAIQIPNVDRTISCCYGCERCLLRNVDDLRKAINTADNRLYQAKEAR